MIKPTTIYDVAKEAGVSTATVSRFFNNSEKVNPKTRIKIEKAISILDYERDIFAFNRAKSGVQRIAILSPYITEPAFVQRLKGIHKAINDKNNYEIVTYSVWRSEHLINYLNTIPFQKHIHGLIIIALPITDRQADHIIKNNLPTVLIENSYPGFSSIGINNIDGGIKAANFILKKGYEKIMCIGHGNQPSYSLHDIDKRIEGFESQLKKNDKILSKDDIVLSHFNMKEDVEIAKEAIEKKNPNAIFACSDMIALSIMTAAVRLGKRIPKDIAVLGFDNIEFAEYFEISTIDQQLEKSGSKAVELLINEMESTNKKNDKEQITLSLELIERKTT